MLLPTLSVGDIAPDCVLRGQDGAALNLRGDAIAGNPIAIVFCPKSTPSIVETLAGYCSRFQAMQAAGARVFAITLRRADLAAQNIPFPVVCDASGEVFRGFTIDVGDHPTTVVLRPNHHVAAIIKTSARFTLQRLSPLLNAWRRSANRL